METMCTTLFSKSKHVIQSQFLNLLEVSAILGIKMTKFGFLRTQKLKDIKAFCKWNHFILVKDKIKENKVLLKVIRKAHFY